MEWKENNGDNRVYIEHTWRRPVRKKSCRNRENRVRIKFWMYYNENI